MVIKNNSRSNDSRDQKLNFSKRRRPMATHTATSTSTTTRSVAVAVAVATKSTNHWNSTMKNLLVVIFTLVTLLPQPYYLASAQESVQTCSCSPAVFYWKLDFTKGCPLQIAEGDGVRDSICNYTELDSAHDGLDFTPVVVTDVRIVDLNLSLTGIKVLTAESQRYLDGTEISFESIVTTGELSGGLQGQFRAVNAAGHSFTLEFLLEYSNLCDVKPFSQGDSLGFLVFVSSVHSIRIAYIYLIIDSIFYMAKMTDSHC